MGLVNTIITHITNGNENEERLLKIMDRTVIETEPETWIRQEISQDIAEMIGIELSKPILNVKFKVLESVQEDGYTRQLIEYDSCGDKVSAYLLLPIILDSNPAILIHHQHNREQFAAQSISGGTRIDKGKIL